MIIDAHAHAFPFLGNKGIFDSEAEHTRYLQRHMTTHPQGGRRFRDNNFADGPTLWDGKTPGFAGYGIPSEAGNEAVLLFGRHEGIILDPIYTGKCAAAMIAHIRESRFSPSDVVVFVHTGGMPAIFTWNDNLLSQAG